MSKSTKLIGATSEWNGKNYDAFKKSNVLHAVPIEESMSEYGREIAESVRSSSRTRSRSNSISTNGTDSSRLETSRKSRVLDPVSRSLADENPSLILYGKPSNISMSLGLGKASSFKSLNETLYAVKHRQNLPERQRIHLNLRDKVNSDIEKMKVATQRNPKPSNAVEMFEDLDARSDADLSIGSYFDLDDSDEIRPPSCIRKSDSRASSRPSSRLSNSSLESQRSRDRFQISPDSSILSEVKSETELILKRHERLQQSRNKPFTSRFLRKVQEQRRTEPIQSDHCLPQTNSLYEMRCQPQNDWRSESPWNFEKTSSLTLQNNLENDYSRDTRNRRDNLSDLPRSRKHERNNDHCDETSFDLSYYGLSHSPENRHPDDNYCNELKSTVRPRSSRSLTKNLPRQSHFRNGQQLVSRSLNRGDDRTNPVKYSSDYEDIDCDDAIYNSDPLDSIISKYLYRK